MIKLIKNPMNALRYAFLAVVVIATESPHALEAPDSRAFAEAKSAVLLRDGVVVDAEKEHIFVLETNGLVARKFASGRKIWSSEALKQPLGFYGDWLMTFSVTGNQRALISFLDPKTGEVGDALAIEFPQATRPLIKDQARQRFSISSQLVNPDVLVRWSHESRPLRGIPASVAGLPTPPALPGGTARAAMPQVEEGGFSRSEGIFRINPVSREVERVKNTDQVPPAPRFAPEVRAEGRALVAGGRSFQALDTEHLAVTDLVDPDRWNRYLWSVSAKGGEKLGDVELPVVYTPFVVAENRLALIMPPFVRRTGDQQFESHGAEVRVFNLGTVELEWFRPILEREYRGEMPP